ncbi:hypothetical protein FH609_012890 [Streptomyces sp. 3MP-14]|uniref:Uncharacterized protein n=1 Tax=Streptomyces mimosae TaxID=2586635 RepID=A0A5N6AI81_9ACTN|nr:MULTISPECIES: hypothetical protein [Streptomyces]KAB8167268.1 hypothetical protein FH607_010340 [Streptomyces mimosae]KAB8177208.1 hypothetical protein FH609_012890 [Streptomyces sp. 3MP-14]
MRDSTVGPRAVWLSRERPQQMADFPMVYTEWHPFTEGFTTLDGLVEEYTQPRKGVIGDRPTASRATLPAGEAARIYYQMVYLNRHPERTMIEHADQIAATLRWEQPTAQHSHGWVAEP